MECKKIKIKIEQKKKKAAEVPETWWGAYKYHLGQKVEFSVSAEHVSKGLEIIYWITTQAYSFFKGYWVQEWLYTVVQSSVTHSQHSNKKNIQCYIIPVLN